jgi:uncharacterized protein YydD (DUF2326 family)
MADEKDLTRVESRLEQLGLKFDDMLRILGKVEPLLEDVPKLRDKIQALEIACATMTSEISTMKTEAKEQRLKAMLATLATSGAVAGGVAVAQHLS